MPHIHDVSPNAMLLSSKLQKQSTSSNSTSLRNLHQLHLEMNGVASLVIKYHNISSLGRTFSLLQHVASRHHFIPSPPHWSFLLLYLVKSTFLFASAPISSTNSGCLVDSVLIFRSNHFMVFYGGFTTCQLQPKKSPFMVYALRTSIPIFIGRWFYANLGNSSNSRRPSWFHAVKELFFHITLAL